MEIRRDKYLQDLKQRMGNGMVKVVTGVRRCGKTYLLFNLFRRYLREMGVDDAHVIEVQLDTRENRALCDPDVLDAYLRSRIENATDQYYVLLDEVQYAISKNELREPETPPRLYGVLNGLLNRYNVDTYVTGSNSKLLSTDVMTEFRGRGDEVRIRPFSFAEFMQGFGGDRYDGWEEYVVYGGMPLALLMPTHEQKAAYLTRLFDEVYFKDIVARYDIRRPDELGSLADVLASNIGSLTSPSKIEATFKSVLRREITDVTIAAYIGYLEDAFLVGEAARYSVKGRKYIGSPKKYYFEDVGLRNARLGFRQLEENHIMENVIYNELLYRGYSVDVGQVEQRGRVNGHDVRKYLEVDFVANKGSERIYVQSAYQIPDDEKRAQEKASLLDIGDSFKKVLLIGGRTPTYYDDDGILTMGLLDFLLDPESLKR